MMQGIIEILTEDTGVQAVVGQNENLTKYKIYPVISPQKEKPPYVVCALTGSGPAQMKGNISDLDQENFDCLIYSNNYEQGHAIDIAIRTALDNKRANTDTGIYFDKIWFVSRRDAAVEGKEGLIYARVVSYSCEVKVSPQIT